MDIDKELEATRKKLQDITGQINQLEQQKQELLQELLRCDGEIRVLVRLKEDKGVD